MADPVFPTLTNLVKPDSSKHTETREDPAMRTEAEGGYVITRAKHTRVPRKSWTVGYRMLLNSDKAALDAFWDLVRGGSAIFDWTNPQDNVLYKVRFKEQIRWAYTGIGSSQRWDCSFSLEQA